MHRNSSVLMPILALILALTALNVRTATAESSIGNVLIVSETTDSVVLEVHYSYDGRQGKRVFASAQMTKDGDVVRYYGYRPGEVSRGKGRTRVQLSTSQGAPDLFTTDGIRVQLYKGGGEAFLTKNVAFAKTWAKARAALPPKMLIVGQVRPVRPGGNLQIQPAPGSGAADGPEGDGQAERRILPDGTVQLRYPDGKIVRLTKGSRTVIMPDGSRQTFMFQHAQAPTPPGAPPNNTHAEWAGGEADRLLGIMRTLVGNDQTSINAYLECESSSSPYGKISQRTRTIDLLVQP